MILFYNLDNIVIYSTEGTLSQCDKAISIIIEEALVIAICSEKE